MIKINKTQALSALKKGLVVTVHRNMVAPNNPMGVGCTTVNLDDLLHFDNLSTDFNLSYKDKIKQRFNRFINTFDYYNHDKELGSKTCYAIDN
jgi:hypothetical protein